MTEFSDRLSFADRSEAGRQLGRRLLLERDRFRNPIVLALPRGGAVVAFEVARMLEAPLEALVVRKIGAPANPEYAVGAVGEDGTLRLNQSAVEAVGATSEEIRVTVDAELKEAHRRVMRYRGGRKLPDLGDRTAIIVDDGLATGATAATACAVARRRGAKRVVLAVPVAAPSSAERLLIEADEVITLAEPEYFTSVGQFYDEFNPTTDEEVVELLERALPSRAPAPLRGRIARREARIEGPGFELTADLRVPPGCRGLVIFAHGSGSSRLSPRNQAVAADLVRGGLGTLLLDLLTPEEAEERSNVFDIPLLADRLALATRWAAHHEETRGLPLGFFGASTGAAAALWAASSLGKRVGAVVSRGGRPDLAMPALAAVQAPTLLIVGSLDTEVLALNRKVLPWLASAELVVVPGATHLFEEPGTLSEVSRHATAWFKRWLVGGRRKTAA